MKDTSVHFEFKSTAVIQLVTGLTKKVDEVLSKDCDLTYAQFKVLVMIGQQQELTQRFVAHCLNSTEAAVSRLTETLEDKRYIVRSANPLNRRENHLLLTSLGYQRLKEACKLVLKLEKKLYSHIDSLEVNSFSQTAQKLLDLVK